MDVEETVKFEVEVVSEVVSVVLEERLTWAVSATLLLMFAGDREVARVMARTLDCPPSTRRKPFFFSQQLQMCPFDCTIVEGCGTLAAPNARNTHQPHSCFWTKSSSPTRKVEVRGTRWPTS